MSDSPDVIRPAVGAGLDAMAATVIPAIDQHIADAAGAHFAEGDFDRVGQHAFTVPQDNVLRVSFS